MEREMFWKDSLLVLLPRDAWLGVLAFLISDGETTGNLWKAGAITNDDVCAVREYYLPPCAGWTMVAAAYVHAGKAKMLANAIRNSHHFADLAARPKCIVTSFPIGQYYCSAPECVVRNARDAFTATNYDQYNLALETYPVTTLMIDSNWNGASEPLLSQTGFARAKWACTVASPDPVRIAYVMEIVPSNMFADNIILRGFGGRSRSEFAFLMRHAASQRTIISRLESIVKKASVYGSTRSLIIVQLFLQIRHLLPLPIIMMAIQNANCLYLADYLQSNSEFVDAFNHSFSAFNALTNY